MFVESVVVLPMPSAAAVDALDRSLADGGLVSESQRAYQEGLSFLMRVGPRGGHGISKQVLVSALPPRQVGATTVVPLRWEATGTTGRLFPSLDANLGLTAIDETSTLLSILGRYDPPFGAVGSGLDRAVLSKAAAKTVDALLHAVAAKMEELRPPRSVSRPGGQGSAADPVSAVDDSF